MQSLWRSWGKVRSWSRSRCSFAMATQIRSPFSLPSLIPMELQLSSRRTDFSCGFSSDQKSARVQSLHITALFLRDALKWIRKHRSELSSRRSSGDVYSVECSMPKGTKSYRLRSHSSSPSTWCDVQQTIVLGLWLCRWTPTTSSRRRKCTRSTSMAKVGTASTQTFWMARARF